MQWPMVRPLQSPMLHPIQVDSGDIRHDIRSEDVRLVFPDLPESSWDRRQLQLRCDLDAYEGIATEYPSFTPPSLVGFDTQATSAQLLLRVQRALQVALSSKRSNRI